MSPWWNVVFRFSSRFHAYPNPLSTAATLSTGRKASPEPFPVFRSNVAGQRGPAAVSPSREQPACPRLCFSLFALARSLIRHRPFPFACRQKIFHLSFSLSLFVFPYFVCLSGCASAILCLRSGAQRGGLEKSDRERDCSRRKGNNCWATAAWQRVL